MLENVPKLEGWNHKGFASIGLTKEGLLMTTQESQGQLARAGNIRHRVDSVAITYLSPQGAKGIFFWQPKDMAGNDAYHIPITFDPSATAKTVVLDMSNISEWDANSKLIGFNIDAQSQLTLQKLEFSGPSGTEQLSSMVKSWFEFDVIHAYSVNFLWGPRLVKNADQVGRVFSQIPPIGSSWNTMLYGILLIAVVGCVALKKPYLMIIIAALWITYDLRMGAELLSYAQTDIQTWWSKPIELKDFRDRGSFTAFTQVAGEFVEATDEQYVLLTPTGWPYYNSLLYETYPAYPISQTDDTTGATLWLVFDMPNVTVNAEGRMTLDGEAISQPGEVLLRYAPGAFIFRVTQ